MTALTEPHLDQTLRVDPQVDIDPHVDPHQGAGQVLRQAEQDLVGTLAQLVEQRDGLNDRIRLLRAQVDTLAMARAAFARRAALEAAAGQPVRRSRRAVAS